MKKTSKKNKSSGKRRSDRNEATSDEHQSKTNGMAVSWSVVLVVAVSIGLGVWSTQLYASQEQYMKGLKETLHNMIQEESSPSDISEDLTNVPCRFVMAESTVPNGGFGVFSTDTVQKNTPILYGEPVIQLVNITSDTYDGVSDLLHRYAWVGDTTGGQHEGATVYSIIPGLSMLANSHNKFNSVSNFPAVHHDGLVRGTTEAGSSTHYHGLGKFAYRSIEAGEEVFVDYGSSYGDEIDFDLEVQSTRSLEWLKENGMCLDNIRAGKAKGKGHSAVATRRLAEGTVIAPMPMIVIDRKSLELPDLSGNHYQLQQLLLNYCYGHEKSSVLMFPYSPTVNLINHDEENPNARVRWSTNNMKDPDSWFQMSAAQVKARKESGLLMELVATRDIYPGEEIRISYGSAYTTALRENQSLYHSLSKKEKGLDNGYVYAFQANERVSIYRTLSEQTEKPYPANLQTSCFYDYSDLVPALQKEVDADSGITTFTSIWNLDLTGLQPQHLRPCSILERQLNDRTQTYTYTVRVFNASYYSSGASIPPNERHIVRNVPLAAILFTDKLSSTDQHLPFAFRHEIGLPTDVFPAAWIDL